MKIFNLIIRKLIYLTAKFFLKFVDFLSPRVFMKLHIWLLRFMGADIRGVPRYISPGAKFDDFSMISIGDRVVISDRVILLTHDYSVTTGLCAIGAVPESDISIKKKIFLGDNVFVGMGSIVMPGAVVESNVIIGAGSVVVGFIGGDSIVAGNPAKFKDKLTTRANFWSGDIDKSKYYFQDK
jgi:acetyltransferase-like isoleucine patch superfamily enzyme